MILQRVCRGAMPLAVLTVLVLPIPGCGGGNDRPEPKAAPAPKPEAARPQPAAVDACALLTKAEAEAALGTPVGDPVRGDVPPVYSCSYVAADKLDNVSVDVTSYTDARQAYDAYLMAVKINNYEEMAGLGDRAYRSVVSDVDVLKGRFELSVDVTLPISKDAQVQKAKEIAARALERLPK